MALFFKFNPPRPQHLLPLPEHGFRLAGSLQGFCSVAEADYRPVGRIGNRTAPLLAETAPIRQIAAMVMASPYANNDLVFSLCLGD
jgi:hypothetical protein